ncbi:MAG: hypothetical protein U1E35_07350 [Rhodospirillales bacterium]
MLFFLYGTGANGKGTFLNTLTGILGDYAQIAGMDTLNISGFVGIRLLRRDYTDDRRYGG